MPEGDTIHRAAARLSRVLTGVTVRDFRCASPQVAAPRLEGARVRQVRALGKHLLLELEDGRVLRMHLRMRGRVRTYDAASPWGTYAERASVVLVSDAVVMLGFDLPDVELLRSAQHSRALTSLGPDLLDPEASIDEMVARLRTENAMPIGVALMSQRLVAGIGNVYKSELLFMERLDPFAAVAQFDDAALRRVLETARRVMKRNTAGGPRVTRKRHGGRLWVYRRSGEPCRICGRAIEMRRQGEGLRSTYYCPECQPRIEVGGGSRRDAPGSR